MTDRLMEDRVREWVLQQDDLRAGLVVGSRARDDHPPDQWSDLDVVLFVRDVERRYRHASWLGEIAPLWLSVRGYTPGGEPECLALFEGGEQVDVVELLAQAGVERVKICSEPDNPAARDLHLDVGFEPVRQTVMWSRSAGSGSPWHCLPNTRSRNSVTPLGQDDGMEIGGVVERAERVAAVRADAAAEPVAIQGALRAVTELRSWLAAAEAALTSRLVSRVSFPEKAVADCTRGSLRDGAKVKERAETLGRVPGLAGALERGDVTAGHVDALTRAGRGLGDDRQRAELFERVDALVDVAAAATVEEFRRRLASEVRAIERDDGIARLERQRRATRLRTWVDSEGMWRFDGRFDPVLGVGLAARIEAELEARFADAGPATCPGDPVEKQAHLRALAFAALVNGEAVSTRPGRPEYVVVVDTAHAGGAGGPAVDWGIPVEIPLRVLAELADGADVHAVVVRNGVVLHAPGELDLGRSTRLANRAQRRALRALYATCAIPGCAVRFDRCKIHHVIWWRHGGRTDLANLLPVCAHHHTEIHDHGWEVTLGPDRELTLTLPDGTIHNTGPPTRIAA